MPRFKLISSFVSEFRRALCLLGRFRGSRSMLAVALLSHFVQNIVTVFRKIVSSRT